MSLHTHTLHGSTWQPMQGPFTRWPNASDIALSIVVFLLTVFISDENSDKDLTIRALSDLPVVAIFVFAVVCGALYWRRRKPLLVLGVNLAALVVLTGLDYPNSLWSLPFALYSVGRYATIDRRSYYGMIATLVLIVASSSGNGEPVVETGFGLMFVFLIWYVGRSIRNRGDYLRLLQERAAQLEREQTSEAHRAVAEERTRIARELHDVVAHKVSLMTVQAGAAKTVAADDPEAALRAMEAVEQAGRQTLGEMRHLLGVLRPEAEDDALSPQSGIADIPQLVEHLTEAGLEISLTMDSAPTDLQARVDLSAYRIVQEALTNVLKHAGPSCQTEVRLSSGKHGVTIVVRDNGQGATILPGSGHGIVGMRERAQLLGGSLQTGPRPGGGFQVDAYLPIKEDSI